MEDIKVDMLRNIGKTRRIILLLRSRRSMFGIMLEICGFID